jgi:hypothetical protein
LNIGLLAIALIGPVSARGLLGVGQPVFASIIWSTADIPVLAALVLEISRSLSKGKDGLDIVAALSMSAVLLFGDPT